MNITLRKILEKNPGFKGSESSLRNLFLESFHELLEALSVATNPKLEKSPLAFRVTNEMIMPYLERNPQLSSSIQELRTLWTEGCQRLIAGKKDMENLNHFILQTLGEEHAFVIFLNDQNCFLNLFLSYYEEKLEQRFEKYISITKRDLPETKLNFQPVNMPQIKEGIEIDSYKILNKLGAGGMGIVYKGFDLNVRRQIAIKFILGVNDKKNRSYKRFLREMELSAQFNHPHIIKVYSTGTFNKFPYMAMEYIDGVPLQDYFRKPDVELDEKLKILIKIANSLHYAHEQKIIHRDIKPSNIMIRNNGDPVLMDFGLGRFTESESRSLTMTGEIMGTLKYMSPEQAQGHNRKLTAQTDVYALGAILYELLTGKRVVEGDTSLEVIAAILNKRPIRPRSLNPEIPYALERICLKALEKYTKHRYKTAKEFAEDLQCYLRGEVTLSTRYYQKKRRKNILQFILLFSIAILLSLIALKAISYRNRKNEVRELRSKYLALKEKKNANPFWLDRELGFLLEKIKELSKKKEYRIVHKKLLLLQREIQIYRKNKPYRINYVREKQKIDKIYKDAFQGKTYELFQKAFLLVENSKVYKLPEEKIKRLYVEMIRACFAVKNYKSCWEIGSRFFQRFPNVHQNGKLRLCVARAGYDCHF